MGVKPQPAPPHLHTQPPPDGRPDAPSRRRPRRSVAVRAVALGGQRLRSARRRHHRRGWACARSSKGQPPPQRRRSVDDLGPLPPQVVLCWRGGGGRQWPAKCNGHKWGAAGTGKSAGNEHQQQYPGNRAKAIQLTAPQAGRARKRASGRAQDRQQRHRPHQPPQDGATDGRHHVQRGGGGGGCPAAATDTPDLRRAAARGTGDSARQAYPQTPDFAATWTAACPCQSASQSPVADGGTGRGAEGGGLATARGTATQQPVGQRGSSRDASDRPYREGGHAFSSRYTSSGPSLPSHSPHPLSPPTRPPLLGPRHAPAQCPRRRRRPPRTPQTRGAPPPPARTTGSAASRARGHTRARRRRRPPAAAAAPPPP